MTLEQHGLELHGSTFMWISSINMYYSWFNLQIGNHGCGGLTINYTQINPLCLRANCSSTCMFSSRELTTRIKIEMVKSDCLGESHIGIAGEVIQIPF